jgi:hypothetical protein
MIRWVGLVFVVVLLSGAVSADPWDNLVFYQDSECSLSGGDYWGTMYDWTDERGFYFTSSNVRMSYSYDGCVWYDDNVSGPIARVIDYSPTLDLFAALGTSSSAFYSVDGLNWLTGSVPFGSGNDGNFIQVIWDDVNDRFFGLSASGRRVVSSDGLNWFDDGYSGVAYSGSSSAYSPVSGIRVFADARVFAIPPNTGPNRYMISYDLQNFSTVSVPGLDYVNEVIYVPELDLFVGVGKTISTSSDGLNWSLHSSGVSGALRRVHYDNATGHLVAVGVDRNDIVVSENGFEWGVLNPPIVSMTSTVTGDLMYNPDTNTWFVSVQRANTPPPSPFGGLFVGRYLGFEWVLQNSTVSSDLYDVVWNTNLSEYLVVGRSPGSIVLGSGDGESWVLRDPPNSSVNYSLDGVGWSESLGQYVVNAQSGLLFGSVDGLSWVELNVSLDPSLFTYDSVWSVEQSRWVVVGDNGQIAFSDDGVNWSVLDGNQSSFGVLAVNAVAYSSDQDKWVAVGEAGHYAESFDGENWVFGNWSVGSNENVTGTLWSVDYSEVLGLWVATGVDGILTSVDGKAWALRDSSFLPYVVRWSSDALLFFAGGELGLAKYSVDGLVWFDTDVGFEGSDILGVDYSSELDLWVVTGEDGKIATSPTVFLSPVPLPPDPDPVYGVSSVLSPVDALRGDALVGSCSAFEVSTNTSVSASFSYSVFVNSLLYDSGSYAGGSITVVPANTLVFGDEVVLVCNATIGDDFVGPVSSDTITIGNTPPLVSEHFVVFDGLDYVCEYEYSDVDFDPEGVVSYDWFVNGASLALNSSVLIGGVVDDDELVCQVTTTDGYNVVVSNSSVFVVGVTGLPVISGFSAPATGTLDQSFVVSVVCQVEGVMASGYPRISFDTPSGNTGNLSMTGGLNDVYTLSYVPSVAGWYENYVVYCMDGNQNLNVESFSARTFVAAPPPPSGGGGGPVDLGPPDLPLCSLELVPSRIVISDASKPVQVVLRNTGSVSISPQFSFVSVPGSPDASGVLRITNRVNQLLVGESDSFGVEYSPGVFSGEFVGSAYLRVGAADCNPVVVLVDVEVTDSALFTGEFDLMTAFATSVFSDEELSSRLPLLSVGFVFLLWAFLLFVGLYGNVRDSLSGGSVFGLFGWVLLILFVSLILTVLTSLLVRLFW